MDNKNIRPEWVPSAYREPEKADKARPVKKSETKSDEEHQPIFGKRSLINKRGRAI